MMTCSFIGGGGEGWKEHPGTDLIGPGSANVNFVSILILGAVRDKIRWEEP